MINSGNCNFVGKNKAVLSKHNKNMDGKKIVVKRSEPT
jgi:hypothetical protein